AEIPAFVGLEIITILDDLLLARQLHDHEAVNRIAAAGVAVLLVFLGNEIMMRLRAGDPAERPMPFLALFRAIDALEFGRRFVNEDMVRRRQIAGGVAPESTGLRR